MQFTKAQPVNFYCVQKSTKKVILSRILFPGWMTPVYFANKLLSLRALTSKVGRFLKPKQYPHVLQKKVWLLFKTNALLRKNYLDKLMLLFFNQKLLHITFYFANQLQQKAFLLKTRWLSLTTLTNNQQGKLQ